jgi:hypothetical protein
MISRIPTRKTPAGLPPGLSAIGVAYGKVPI